MRPLGGSVGAWGPHPANPDSASPGQSLCSPQKQVIAYGSGLSSDLGSPNLSSEISFRFSSFLDPFLHSRFSNLCGTSCKLSPHLPHSRGPLPTPHLQPCPPSSFLLNTLKARAPLVSQDSSIPALILLPPGSAALVCSLPSPFLLWPPSAGPCTG